MTFAAELVTAGASMWLCAYAYSWWSERRKKRKRLDAIIDRGFAEMRRNPEAKRKVYASFQPRERL